MGQEAFSRAHCRSICCTARSSTAQPYDRSLNNFIRPGPGPVLRASVRRHSPTTRTRSTARAFTLLAFGCSIAPRAISVNHIGPASRVEVYEGGQTVFQRSIAAGSAEEHVVKAWLEKHSTGWQPTLITFVPSRRITGENFNLNFCGNDCVLNYAPDGKGAWIQLIRPIAADDPIPDVSDHSKKLLALYGLEWNPFSSELPGEAPLATPRMEHFA